MVTLKNNWENYARMVESKIRTKKLLEIWAPTSDCGSIPPFLMEIFFPHPSQIIFDLAKQGAYFKAPNSKIMEAL